MQLTRSCPVFIAFQCFSNVFFSSVIHLACVCIDYLHLQYTHLQFMLICGFKIFFCIIHQFNLSISMFSQKCTHLLFSVFYYESIALNTNNFAHFCLYLSHETYKNCVQIIFFYLMLQIFSSVLYPVFIANTIISALQVYCVVPVWSSSYNDIPSHVLHIETCAHMFY